LSNFVGKRVNTLRFLANIIRQQQNRRRFPRKDANSQAWISLNGGFAVRPCTLINISETGVRIAVEGPQTVPGAFTLRMSRNATSGRPVRVKWRYGSHIGGVFV
jgi:hypothetical protein